MKVKVIMYGGLKKKAAEVDESTGTIGKTEIDIRTRTTIADLLDRLDIEEKDVSHIFLNREYSDLSREVEDGDRLALFPRDMALLYKWYFTRKK